MTNNDVLNYCSRFPLFLKEKQKGTAQNTVKLSNVNNGVSFNECQILLRMVLVRGGMELGGMEYKKLCQGIEVIEDSRMYHPNQMKDT